MSVATKPVSVETHELSNGLRVVLAPLSHLHRAAIACVVEVGARYEDEASSGLSHFLEHMLHRGTPSYRSAHELAAGIEGMGANLDAATGVDRGSLVVTTPPEMLFDALGVLGEVMTQPLFTDVDIERGIVREELLEDRDERGRLIDPDGVVRRVVFGAHPLGYPIVGTPTTLRRFGVPMLKTHHARHYTARSSVVALAGKLPTARGKLLRNLETAFGKVPRGERLRPPRFRSQAALAGGLSIVRTTSVQASLRVACVAPGRKDRRAAASELLIRLIDDGNATRLYERLCDSRGLCYDVSAGYEAYDEAGLFDIAAEATEEAIPEVLKEIVGILEDLASRGPSPEEVAKAVQRARWHAARTLDQPESLAEQIGCGVLGADPLTPFVRAERMAACSPRQVRALARSMFRRERLAVAVVGDLGRGTERELRRIFAGAVGQA